MNARLEDLTPAQRGLTADILRAAVAGLVGPLARRPVIPSGDPLVDAYRRGARAGVQAVIDSLEQTADLLDEGADDDRRPEL